MTSINRAIPTRYKDILFRSKLEADWAITLDTAGIQWEYEPEGRYWDGEMYYAPDFWLPGIQQWFEVKGEPAEVDFQKWKSLANNWTPTKTPELFSACMLALGTRVCTDLWSGDGEMWIPPLVVGMPNGVLGSLYRADYPRWPDVGLVPNLGFICWRDNRTAPDLGRVYAVNGVSPFPLREWPSPRPEVPA